MPTLLRWSARLQPQIQEQVTASFDWLPTLLAAAGAAQHPDFPSDGQNILPILEGRSGGTERTLFWRYKSQSQRAARQGPWKYLKINDNEFLFNVVDDARERANLKEHQPEIFARLRRQWEEWNESLLPIAAENYSHGLSPDIQADRCAQPLDPGLRTYSRPRAATATLRDGMLGAIPQQ